MKHSRTLARFCTLEFALVAGAGLLLLLGICCVVAPFMLSYSSVRGHLDSLAMDGHAEEFDQRTYRTLIFALGSTGALILPASVLALLLRRQVSRVSKEVIRHAAVELRDAASAYWVDADPRSYWFSLLVITGIALWVRFVFLQQPMRFDEARTFLNYSSKQIYIILSNY